MNVAVMKVGFFYQPLPLPLANHNGYPSHPVSLYFSVHCDVAGLVEEGVEPLWLAHT